ncbi:hypothetical protein [Plantibacter sp. ME-Dv--P-122b]|uniref:hypothetical protein n=1 Tax=Plantibacter sp. ME-Dv--P-122b TaxID=3040300 RepID=UPI00254C0A28|nr:hypothetical protein [Plantibacter sp. ME-Dv--P-122b]
MTLGPALRVAGGLITLAAALFVGTATGTATTEGAWSDQARFNITAGTGSWLPPASTLGSCVVIDAGGDPVDGASCSISSVRLVEQGGTTPGNLLREYELTTSSSGRGTDDLVAFQVDLASPDVDSSQLTPNPDWSWSTASTSPTSGYTIDPGYPCSALPTLRGTLTSGATGPTLLKVNDHLADDRNCVQ